MGRRVFLVVLDSVGIGALPDADLYGDAGSNTLAAAATSAGFSMPNMERLGLFDLEGVTQLKKGTKAPEAAGKIHSDIQRGFIKAEVVSYDDLIREGSMNAVREKGLLRMEGKEYIMQDGDIVLFRFNV